MPIGIRLPASVVTGRDSNNKAATGVGGAGEAPVTAAQVGEGKREGEGEGKRQKLIYFTK